MREQDSQNKHFTLLAFGMTVAAVIAGLLFLITILNVGERLECHPPPPVDLQEMQDRIDMINSKADLALKTATISIEMKCLQETR